MNGTIRQEKRIVMNRTLDIVVDSGSVGGSGFVVVVVIVLVVVVVVVVAGDGETSNYNREQ